LVEQLLEDYSVIIKGLREGVEVAGEVGDEVSVDLMIGALAEYEKTVWMLRAFLHR
jgi:starvation-inducible DNA-binding protein